MAAKSSEEVIFYPSQSSFGWLACPNSSFPPAEIVISLPGGNQLLSAATGSETSVFPANCRHYDERIEPSSQLSMRRLLAPASVLSLFAKVVGCPMNRLGNLPQDFF